MRRVDDQRLINNVSHSVVFKQSSALRDHLLSVKSHYALTISNVRPLKMRGLFLIRTKIKKEEGGWLFFFLF